MTAIVTLQPSHTKEEQLQKDVANRPRRPEVWASSKGDSLYELQLQDRWCSSPNTEPNTQIGKSGRQYSRACRVSETDVSVQLLGDDRCIPCKAKGCECWLDSIKGAQMAPNRLIEVAISKGTKRFASGEPKESQPLHDDGQPPQEEDPTLKSSSPALIPECFEDAVLLFSGYEPKDIKRLPMLQLRPKSPPPLLNPKSFKDVALLFSGS